MAAPTTFTILRDDAVLDGIAGRSFATYGEAYRLLERYYADCGCSLDSVTYRIVEVLGEC
ncbi:MAG: hypothetical protein VKP70_09595 [Cyanobacteriota bacterium]|nr:hypothetical protein [Cyanobacteriota bacterium]